MAGIQKTTATKVKAEYLNISQLAKSAASKGSNCDHVYQVYTFGNAIEKFLDTIIYRFSYSIRYLLFN